MKRSEMPVGRNPRLGSEGLWRWGLVWVAALCGSVGLGCGVPENPSHATATLAIENVTLVEVDEAALVADQTILMEGSRILAIGPAAEIRPPAGIEIVDGTGTYAVPGLWDMHVHAVGDVDDAFDRVFPLLVANGVTGVRDMGMSLEQLSRLRKRQTVDTGALTPHLRVAGPLLDGVRLPWYRDLPLVLETPEQVEPALEKLRDLEVDFLKTYDGLSAEVYAEITRLADSWSLPVSGHVPDAVPVESAARAGLHTAEHIGIDFLRDCVEDGDRWFQRSLEARFGEGGLDGSHRVNRDFWNEIEDAKCDRMFATLAEERVYFTPTLTMVVQNRARTEAGALPYLGAAGRDWCESLLEGIDEADAELREEHYGQIFATVDRMRQAGVKILAGSDSENNCLAPGFSLHWELQRLVEAGMTPAEVLRTATAVAAEAVGLEQLAGRLEETYWADILLLQRNPLEDITALRELSGLVLQGRYLSESDLEELLEKARRSNEEGGGPAT